MAVATTARSICRYTSLTMQPGHPSTSFGYTPSQAVSAVCPMPGIQSLTLDPDRHSSATHLSRVRESSVYSGRSFKSLGEAESWCG